MMKDDDTDVAGEYYFGKLAPVIVEVTETDFRELIREARKYIQYAVSVLDKLDEEVGGSGG